MSLDIAANRDARKYTSRELVLRAIWGLCTPLFRFSPRVCWGWRRWLLRRLGARIGTGVHIYPSVVIFAPWAFAIGDDSAIGFDALIYNLGPITLGDRVTISQRAHLCAGTHDHTQPSLPLLKPPIVVEDDVWICADAFVGPGIRVGARSVVAARAVVVKDVEPGSIVGGNPARPLG